MLGTLLTPVPRYRPQQLARQVATLDHLSDGRVIFDAGLGGPIEDEYRSFGDAAEPRLLAERLDEGLEVLKRFWSGEPVNHHGRHYEVREDVTLLPATVQRPGPPVWIGGFWPRRPPMRRAARWDGAVPLFETARHGHVPDVAEVRELVGYVRKHRAAEPERPFEYVLGGATPLDAAKGRDAGQQASLGRAFQEFDLAAVVVQRGEQACGLSSPIPLCAGWSSLVCGSSADPVATVAMISVYPRHRIG
ncbi:LLM class flavin-dependent oxidoreductase [Streptomyces sp. NPDC002671]